MSHTPRWAVALSAMVVALVTAGLVTMTPGHGTAAQPFARHRTTSSGFATPTKVLTVVEENHSYAQARAGMPYLMSLASQYAYASDWTAIRHPSLPNYLAVVGGSTFGVTTDSEPIPSSKVGTAASVFGQALALGKTAKVYAESMTGSCSPTAGGGYVPRHNPWVYFGAEVSACRLYDVPASGFLTDAQNDALPAAGLLVPDLCDDAHDCSLATADSWLKARLPTVLSSTDFTSGRLTVVVTFDEDDNTTANKVLTVVMNAGIAGRGQVSTPLTHYSLTGYYDRVLGAPLLRNATADLAGAFGLP